MIMIPGMGITLLIKVDNYELTVSSFLQVIEGVLSNQCFTMLRYMLNALTKSKSDAR